MCILKQSTPFCVVWLNPPVKVIPTCLGCTLRAVYNLWYSFVFTFSEASGDNDTPAMPATTPSSVATNPDLNTVRVASQTTGRIRFCADNDTSRAPSVGFSPRPPPAADNIAFPTANNGYNVDSSPHPSRIEEQLLVAEPRHFDTSLNRLPVFRRLGKENRAPPLNYRSRDTSTEGEATLLGIFSGCMKYGRDSGGGHMSV